VTGPDLEFTTRATVANESFSGVGSTSAVVTAEIEPGGTPTTYYVEYGTSSAYGNSTAPISVGDGEESVPVISHLSELDGGATYHFRFVAAKEGNTEVGPDLAFITTAVAAQGLPDGRGYEMVTPADNQGSEPYVPTDAGSEGESSISTSYPALAAEDGNAVSYVGSPTATGDGSEGNGRGNQLLATRNAEGGWTQTDIQPPGYDSVTYWGFSPNLETTLLDSRQPLAAGVGAEYQDLYVREGTTGSLQPLFTGTPPNRLPGEFAAASAGGYVGSEKSLGEYYAGASLDFTHLLFSANDALTGPPALDPGSADNNLYESVDGELQLANVLPDGSAAPNASFGAAQVESPSPVDFSHVISADGSRVFWTDVNSGALYVREDGTRTSLIAEDATYLTASTDGSKVLYTKAGDLYEADVETGTSQDLAVGGEVLGIAGTSDDLEYVYFVGKAVLAANAVAGQSNLYLLHDGVTSLIATLGTAEEERFGISFLYGQANTPSEDLPWQSDIGRRTAESTPSGHDLVFMSTKSLTGYDNVKRPGAQGQPEVYVYDADSGELACASCNPTGEPPVSYGGFLPLSAHPTFQERVISDEGGRVFFASAEPLLPRAEDGELNVFEWERDGTGSCRYERGCIYLISTGSSSAPSTFIGASASGNDVFIITKSQLVSADKNEYNDIYDARVGATEAPPSPQCTGTGCQGAPATPPIFATPASVTFNGAGNLLPAAKPGSEIKAKPKKKSKQCPARKKKKKKKKKSTKQAKQSKSKPVHCATKKPAKGARHSETVRGAR